MPITINGSGTVTGISAGGLPDGVVTTAEVADANITAAKLNGAQTGTAPIYGCRAWVNFDGTRDTTGTVSTANTDRLIRASGNVTSVLRNSVGEYTVTFATPMADANYCANISAAAGTSGTEVAANQIRIDSELAASIRFRTGGVNASQVYSAYYDNATVNVAIFR
jgi:hypothetical protein